MARIEVHIRRPPCRYCTSGLVASRVLGMGHFETCQRCRGQSGVVEYSMFVSSDHGMTGRWLEWPTDDQAVIKRMVADILDMA